MLGSLRDQDVGGWEQFDHWKLRGNYDHANVPDGNADLIIVAYRGLHKEIENGWRQEAWAHLGGQADYLVGDTLRLTVRAGQIAGSGVTWQHAIGYPDIWAPLHEVAHYLLGANEYYRDPCGGLWSALGLRQPNVSASMNGYERDQLGWLTVRDATDGMETDLPDFATERVAARIIASGNEGLYEYYFENHQGKNSPYITTAEDGVFTYDVVDRKGKRGLYIVERDLADVKVVCADGRWRWDSVGAMPNPGNPALTAHVFRRGAMDRDSGLTDRRPQEYHQPDGRPAYEYMWAWRDERTDAVTWMMHPRNFGDGNDTWDADANNVFSPWSNPAAVFVSRPTLATGAAEVIRENSDSSVRVRFYIANPVDAPPSRPQALTTRTAPGFAGGANPVLHWEPNVEPDVTTGGAMEIWKRLEPYGEAPGQWVRVATAGPTAVTFTDEAVTDARTSGGGNVARYRLRAVDASGKYSCYSEDRAVYYGLSPLKAVRGAAAADVPSVAAEISGTMLTLRLHEGGTVRLGLYTTNGGIAEAFAAHVYPAGTHTVELPLEALPNGTYFLTVDVDGKRVATLPVTTVH